MTITLVLCPFDQNAMRTGANARRNSRTLDTFMKINTGSANRDSRPMSRPIWQMPASSEGQCAKNITLS